MKQWNKQKKRQKLKKKYLKQQILMMNHDYPNYNSSLLDGTGYQDDYITSNNRNSNNTFLTIFTYISSYVSTAISTALSLLPRSYLPTTTISVGRYKISSKYLLLTLT